MELLKRTRFGLEKLRLLCERVLRREKFKRQAMDLNAELWTMQMAGMDDGKAAATSPPPSPSRRTTLLTPTLAAAANEQLARAGYEYTPAT
jgi:bromodomain and PHD finger-containing protein 1